MAYEVDKCYLCDLLGDFDEFKDIKEQFDAQHEYVGRSKMNLKIKTFQMKK